MDIEQCCIGFYFSLFYLDGLQLVKKGNLGLRKSTTGSRIPNC